MDRSQFFVLGQRGKSSDDEFRPRCAKRERETVSDFYSLITPPRPSVAPGASSTVSRLNGSRGPCSQLARYRAPPIVLT